MNDMTNEEMQSEAEVTTRAPTLADLAKQLEKARLDENNARADLDDCKHRLDDAIAASKRATSEFNLAVDALKIKRPRKPKAEGAPATPKVKKPKLTRKGEL